MTEGQCALYARVSSESQARDNTIASQVTALRERIVADGFQLEPDRNYVDEGYSGTNLFRPALVQIEGLSHRETARRFGLDPRTVAKMVRFSVPPGYVRRSEEHTSELQSLRHLVC